MPGILENVIVLAVLAVVVVLAVRSLWRSHKSGGHCNATAEAAAAVTAAAAPDNRIDRNNGKETRAKRPCSCLLSVMRVRIRTWDRWQQKRA